MAMMIAPHFFRLGATVADEFEPNQKFYKFYLWLAVVNALGLFFTPFYVKGLWSFGVFKYQPLGGPLYIVFTLLFFWCTIHSFLVAALKYRYTSGSQRAQLRLFLWGTGIAYSGGGELFLQGLGVAIPSYGVFPILAYVILIGYAVHKYQFLNVELVLKRTVVFAGLTSVVFGFVALATLILQSLVGRVAGLSQTAGVAITVAVVILFFHPLENALIYLTDRYLFQKKYDYKELLRKFTDEVMVVLDLKQLVQMTVQTLSETVKLEGCSLLLLNKDTRQYELVAAKGTNGRPVAFDAQEPFIALLKETYEPIRLDERSGKPRLPVSVSDRVKPLRAEWALPLKVHDDLIGVLCLGKRKSDEEFSKDDFDILQPLARTLAIAMNNAQLVEEIKQKEAIEKKAVVSAMQSDKMATIGTLSAGINHEICNPLGIVKAQCEAFLLDAEDGILIGKSQQDVLERTSNIMRVALKQIDRATAITQKLSNFAKPVKDIKPQEVSVQEEVEEVLPLVGHDLTLQKIEVKTEIAPNLPLIWVDRKQLQEVLFNLIRNAAQAITPPGTIWVRAHLEGREQVRIEIADTGSGIPPDQLEKIYDPFFTTKDPGKGTGLGLFIVRQVVERNKGRIAVESAVGKGTTFFLDFPAAQQAMAAA